MQKAKVQFRIKNYSSSEALAESRSLHRHSGLSRISSLTRLSSKRTPSLRPVRSQTLHSFVLPLLFVLMGALLRLLPHPPNVAPIAAMALFGGVYLDKKYALVVPLAAMFLSDIFLGFHDTMGFVYGSFLLTGFIGLFLRTHKHSLTVLLGSLISSLLFFLITNFGVWLMGTMYTKNLSGLFDAYVMGLPFFRNTILGDLFYSGVFFGAYEAIETYVKHKQKAVYGTS